MKIVPNAGGGVSATYKHMCGHDNVPLYYANESFASQDRVSQEASKCVHCVNDDHVARNRKEKLK